MNTRASPVAGRTRSTVPDRWKLVVPPSKSSLR
jgi:hypothetical protein